MAVLSTVPWIVMAPVRVWADAPLATPTKPPKDFAPRAGFEDRNAVLIAMRAV